MSEIVAHTFDVYDTLVTRDLAQPADLFFVLARRVLREAMGREPTDEEAHQFVDLRIATERSARKARYAADPTLQDVTLADIYAHLPKLFQGSARLDAERIMAMELAIEAEAARPVARGAALLAEARRTGKKVAYISDMYLPTEAVSRMLDDLGLRRPGEPVFVSGDVGLTKRTGALFSHVAEALGLRAEQVLHTGDYPRADIAPARALGMRARRLADACLTPGEQNLVSLPGVQCDLHSRLAGACRLARLDTADGFDDPAWAELAADVVAPLACAFSAWVLDDARERGLDALHFVSRDAKVLLASARILAEASPGGPRLNYLHGSRQAWFLPSLATGNGDESLAGLDWLMPPGHSKRPDHVLARLDLAPAELAFSPHPPDSGWFSTPLDPAGEKIFQKILSHPGNQELILAKAGRAREKARVYLDSQGLGGGEASALVDVGWTLKAQRSLRRILGDKGTGISGYYLGVSQARPTADQCGPFRAWIIEREPYLDPDQSANYLFRNANLVEQVLAAADHGRVTGYAMEKGRAVPCLAPEPPRAELRRARAVARTVARFSEIALEAGLAAPKNIPLLRRAATHALRELITRPEPRLALALAASRVFDDQNESRARPLCRGLTPGDIFSAALTGRPGLGRLLRLGRNGGYGASFDWIEGSIALSAPWLRPYLAREKIFELLRGYRKSL